MRYALLAILGLLGAALPAQAVVNFSISIGDYPSMVVIPGYPVYYAPGLDYNFFFYDGLYWVYQEDRWYSSAWYNGPWEVVDPFTVPLFMLQVPVRYYRRPPVFFRGWQGNDAPHWGEHWGSNWSQRRPGWNQHPSGGVPAPAPLPDYQRAYHGNNYPAAGQQRALQPPGAPRVGARREARLAPTPQQPAPRQQGAEPQRNVQPDLTRRPGPAEQRPVGQRGPERPGSAGADPRQQPTQQQQRLQPRAQQPPQAPPGQRQGNEPRGDGAPRGAQRQDPRDPPGDSH